MRWAPRVIVFLAIFAVGAAAFVAANHYTETEAAAPPPPAPVEAAPPMPPPAVGSQWRYTTPRAATAAVAGDEACTKATADIAIGGAGRSGAELCLRRGGGYPYGASILLGDEQGQFACADCAVTVRFDNGGAQSFDATAASTDGARYTLFIRDGARLANALKRASTATFTLSVRGAGQQDATFTVSGLRWSG